MKRIPPRPDLGHLKKQAKTLLSSYRQGDAAAIAQFRAHLPAAAARSDAAIAAMDLRLHDAQSCIAREYGFVSWADLQGFVLARQAAVADPARALRHWLALVYAGDVAGGNNAARPAVAERLLAETPQLLGDDPWLACAVGDEAALRAAIARDPAWVHRAGGPLKLPPLVAVTHSAFLQLPAYRDRMRACVRLLLEAGADADQSIGNRWPPASLAAPNEDERLTALYGAAGQQRDPQTTRLLLDAGADPDDNESLYHSLENRACTALLLAAGARVTGTNALYRVLDLDDVEALKLLLAHGGDPNESAGSAPTNEWGTPLLWAIRRRRSPAHIEALLAAGADTSARTREGIDARTLALRFGLVEVARLLEGTGGEAQDAPQEAFIAACARADEPAARALQAAHPGLVDTLSESQLRLLSELAAQEGCGDAVRTMVRCGWPIAARGGDWDASALNQAVFRGDAAMARFLLEHGAQWTERHAYGDNCAGTLCWASLNRPESTEPGGGDWLGCAQALIDHGMPLARPDPEAPGCVLIDGSRQRYPEEIADLLLGVAAG